MREKFLDFRLYSKVLPPAVFPPRLSALRTAGTTHIRLIRQEPRKFSRAPSARKHNRILCHYLLNHKNHKSEKF